MVNGQRVISFPLNFGINDPPLPPLIRGVGGIEFVAGIFLIDITRVPFQSKLSAKPLIPGSARSLVAS
jgi:hypothetical protein